MAAALVGVLTLISTARAAVVFQDLGTGPPTGTVGPVEVVPFKRLVQEAIPNSTVVSTIPGSPIPGDLTVAPSLAKATVPAGGWNTWSHGYTGPVFVYDTDPNNVVMTLPPGATAFAFYAEPNSGGMHAITATTNDGTTSGPILVEGISGANGYGFYTTAGETIATVTLKVAQTASGFAIGEFAIAGPADLDHYKCYKGRDLKTPPFARVDPNLDDQFASETNTVIKPFLVCNPVDKNGEGIKNPLPHLCCYKLKSKALNPKPKVEIESQFQKSQLELKKAQLLCAPCSKTVLP
jgi:hypothetical protein